MKAFAAARNGCAKDQFPHYVNIGGCVAWRVIEYTVYVIPGMVYVDAMNQTVGLSRELVTVLRQRGVSRLHSVVF